MAFCWNLRRTLNTLIIKLIIRSTERIGHSRASEGIPTTVGLAEPYQHVRCCFTLCGDGILRDYDGLFGWELDLRVRINWAVGSDLYEAAP